MNREQLIERLAERQWRRMTRTTTPYASLNENDKRACRALVVPILDDVLGELPKLVNLRPLKAS